jgi:hypothetical protein
MGPRVPQSITKLVKRVAKTESIMGGECSIYISKSNLVGELTTE